LGVAQVGRGYAPIGQTPEIQPNTQRVSVNYLASVSNQGKVRFMLYTQKLTAQVFITFLERLIAKPILRTELGGYDAVGAEVLIVGTGFNQGWVQL
jgi:hypothetical protein